MIRKIWPALECLSALCVYHGTGWPASNALSGRPGGSRNEVPVFLLRCVRTSVVLDSGVGTRTFQWGEQSSFRNCTQHNGYTFPWDELAIAPTYRVSLGKGDDG
jgi:hypothetical protein